MSAHPRSIKNFFVNPKFQWRFMGYFLGLFVLTSASLYSTTFLFFWRLHKKAINVGIPEEHVFHKFLAEQKSEMDLLFVGLLVLNLVLLLGIGFAISHRIAGPLKKLKTYLESDDAQGDFKLRDKDFFQELAPLVNDLKKKKKEKE
jgi:hypothetical protein